MAIQAALADGIGATVQRNQGIVPVSRSKIQDFNRFYSNISK